LPSCVYDPLPLKATLTDKDFNLAPIQAYHHSSFKAISIEISCHTSFPLFHFELPFYTDNRHKDCTAILRLAQTFGLLKFEPENNNINQWQPLARIYIGDKANGHDFSCSDFEGILTSLEDIFTNLDKAATAIDNEATPLIHQWLHEIHKGFVKSNKPYLTVGSIKKPFANIDIRDHFQAIEEFITKEYELY
jgi:hypothetical protein